MSEGSETARSALRRSVVLPTEPLSRRRLIDSGRLKEKGAYSHHILSANISSQFINSRLSRPSIGASRLDYE